MICKQESFFLSRSSHLNPVLPPSPKKGSFQHVSTNLLVRRKPKHLHGACRKPWQPRRRLETPKGEQWTVVPCCGWLMWYWDILGLFQVGKKGLTLGDWEGNPYQPEVHPTSFFRTWKRRRNKQKLQRRTQRQLSASWTVFYTMKQLSVIPQSSNNFATLLCHVLVRKAPNPWIHWHWFSGQVESCSRWGKWC